MIGFQLDIEPDIKEVFTALDDEAYVENELDDDFFLSFNAEEVPAKYHSLLVEQEEAYDDFDENEESWMKEFKR